MLNLKEDKELCALFKAESDERLQRIEEGLLRLETGPVDRAVAEELFRDIHTLKGSAGMVGAGEIQSIAHSFEDLLGGALRGGQGPDAGTLGRLQRGLDVLVKLVDEVVTGEPAGIDLWNVLAELRAPAGEMATLSEPAPFVPPVAEAPSPQPSPEIPQQSAPETHPLPPEIPASRSLFQIDTIRVDPGKLDALMTHASELAVARTRLVRRLAEAEGLAALWEEHSREMAVRRRVVQDVAALLSREVADRLLSASEQEKLRADRIGEEIEHLRSGLAEESTKLDFVATELGDGIRAVRLLPLTTIFNLFPRMVRDLAREQEKSVRMVIEGGEIAVDKRILEEIKDPLMHMLRNAVDHGIETVEERRDAGKEGEAIITIRASQTPTNTVIEVLDDGRGLDLERIGRIARQRGMYDAEELARMTRSQLGALIFTSGFSTRSRVTDISGRGIGMDVVRTNIERLKGSINVGSVAGAGTTFTIQLPLKLATARVLIVAAGGENLALPVEGVLGARLLESEEIHIAEGKETIMVEGLPVSIAPLAELLELREVGRSDDEPPPPRAPRRLHCVILEEGGEKFGVIVDALIDEQEVVLKPESGLLRRVRNVSGSTILGSGKVCVILNPYDLLKSIQNRTAIVPTLRPPADKPVVRKILLVEDSLTTRTQVKRILEAAGYEVVTAVDGMDGLAKLGARPFDAIISDVQMPNMDGLSMTARIREQDRYAALPIVLMTSLAREEDRRRGIEVGASAYLTKPAFDQKVLIDTLGRLI